MNKAEWLACTDPTAILEFLGDKASDRKLRLFAVAWCRTVSELLPDESARRALQIAELAADGQADPVEMRNLLEEIGPRINTQYGAFLCGGCGGPGCTYAAMAATATLNPALTFTWYMGQTPSETLTAWECVARAKAQTAKEEAQEKRWQERDEVVIDSEDEPDDAWYEQTQDAGYNAWDREYAAARAGPCVLLRDIFGLLPFRPATFDFSWLAYNDGTVVKMAHSIYPDRAFDRMPILGDALEESGCQDADILAHCRQPGSHVRGCWVVDSLTGRA
jgi:hypothetical protein